MKLLETFKEILDQGKEYGLEIGDFEEKLQRITESLSQDTIRIVLLGSISDGKTSVVSGVLGKVFDFQKIDIDESSDELNFFQLDFLGKKVELVDTPGLFGTKEKEIDGKNVRYSDITKKYISEANILLYVCDAVVPLKDSHVEVMKTVLRTFNKLDSTIFVINKMDAAGTRMKDPEDYERVSQIKKENLINRLRQTIDLTDEEAEKLKIVCVAADPKGKGLEHWFSKLEDYKQRSHIDLVKAEMEKLVEATDSQESQELASKEALKDMSMSIISVVNHQILPLTHVIHNSQEGLLELQSDIDAMKQNLENSRMKAKEKLNTLHTTLIAQIRDASPETIPDILLKSFGMKGEEITGYIFESKVNDILNQCLEENKISLQSTSSHLEDFSNTQNQLMDKALKGGVNWLKGQKITNTTILSIRNEFFKNVKFKPYGAKNLAANITKWGGRALVAVTVIWEAYSMYKKYKQAKEFKEFKTALSASVAENIEDVIKLLDDNDKYFKDFAPTYAEQCEALKQLQLQFAQTSESLQQFTQYADRIKQWARTANIEDVDYEEIEDVEF